MIAAHYPNLTGTLHTPDTSRGRYPSAVGAGVQVSYYDYDDPAPEQDLALVLHPDIEYRLGPVTLRFANPFAPAHGDRLPCAADGVLMPDGTRGRAARTVMVGRTHWGRRRWRAFDPETCSWWPGHLRYSEADVAFIPYDDLLDLPDLDAVAAEQARLGALPDGGSQSWVDVAKAIAASPAAMERLRDDRVAFAFIEAPHHYDIVHRDSGTRVVFETDWGLSEAAALLRRCGESVLDFHPVLFSERKPDTVEPARVAEMLAGVGYDCRSHASRD